MHRSMMRVHTDGGLEELCTSGGETCGTGHRCPPGRLQGSSRRDPHHRAMLTTQDTEVADAIRAGVMAITPLIIGFAPFALVVGATIGSSANHGAGIASSWLIYGGSAAARDGPHARARGAAIAVLTALLIQTRLLVYSASLSQHWQDQPRWFRVAAAPMLVDPVWAVAEARALQPGSSRAQRADLLRCRDHAVRGLDDVHRHGRDDGRPSRQPRAQRHGAIVPALARGLPCQGPSQLLDRLRRDRRCTRGPSTAIGSRDLRRHPRRLRCW